LRRRGAEPLKFNHLARPLYGISLAFQFDNCEVREMSKQHTFDLPTSLHSGPYIQLEHSLPSEIAAISPFVDKLMLLIIKCRCVPGNEGDVEIALREALANAIIHGNHEDPRKHIYVSCRCELYELSISVRDEGQGFDINKLPDPTSPENIKSDHGRGIYMMKASMDEVRFEEAGTVVHMRKTASNNRHAILTDL
jgi:serine/threonine-protein kinase RsbW